MLILAGATPHARDTLDLAACTRLALRSRFSVDVGWLIDRSATRRSDGRVRACPFGVHFRRGPQRTP